MEMGNESWSFLAALLYLSAFFFFFKSHCRGIAGSIIATCFILITIIFSLLTGCYLVANWFTGIGFDDSVFYHLRFGVEGGDFSDFYFLIFYFLLSQAIFAVLIIIYLRSFLKSKKTKFKIVSVVEGVIMVLCAFFCAPATSNLIAYSLTSQSSGDFSDYFIKPQVIASTPKPKNIIYFYLESLEGNYMDESLFPGLLPELHKIEKDSVTFTNIGQTIGSSWTMAGMVSSQCGMPLLSVFTNDNFQMNNFMPNAVCLGDILKSKGYHLEFMGGAETEFAGKGQFYKDHGFSDVKGKKEFVDQHVAKDYINNWGLYDDTLYEQLLTRVASLRQTQTSWGLFSINIGTHQPEGYLAHECESMKYGDGIDHLLNAAHCTDYLIGKVYQSLKKEGLLDDTLLVFGSDHLAPVMVKTLQTLKKKERHNLLMITGAGIKPTQNPRHGTTLDVSPTILNYLNYGSHPVGLGRDLNGNMATLVENFSGQMFLDKKLLSWRTTIDMAFWGYPDINGSVEIDSHKKQVKIGGKSFKIPSLIRYTETGKIEDVVFSSDNIISVGNNSYLPAFFLVNLISNNQMFLWIDTCRELSTLNPELRSFDNQYCYYNGSLSSIHSASGLISKTPMAVKVSLNEDNAYSSSRANDLRNALKDRNLMFWTETLLKSEKTHSFPPVNIMSAGHHSLIQPSILANRFLEGDGLFLTRFTYTNLPSAGVTIYPEFIGKLAVCDKKQGEISLSRMIKDAPPTKGKTNLFYAIMGNVDPECSKGIVNRIDLDLPQFVALTAEKPYIAILDDNLRPLTEHAGRPDQSIAIQVKFNDDE